MKNLYNIAPEGYPQCFIKMGKTGLIPRSLAKRLAKTARPRNLLVHRYWVIDDKKLYEAIAKCLKDFEDYANAVEAATRS